MIEIRRMKSEGASYIEIARRFNVKPNAISNLFKVRVARPPMGSPCSRCGRSDVPLQCHHIDYENNIWTALCHPCHIIEHQTLRATPNGKVKTVRIKRLATAKQPRKKLGFAAMSREKRIEIARLGGKKVSEDRNHMKLIGRKGGQTGWVLITETTNLQTVNSGYQNT